MKNEKPRSRLISDAKALSKLLLRLEAEKKAVDPHAALRLAEIVLELYGAEESKPSPSSPVLPWRPRKERNFHE